MNIALFALAGAFIAIGLALAAIQAVIKPRVNVIHIHLPPSPSVPGLAAVTLPSFINQAPDQLSRCLPFNHSLSDYGGSHASRN